ncbi:energy-coupling factor transport system ATP-binding protein [Lentibacillus persicus]|uniref:Energy-coupling factor transport system ATP-binding protein n=1 Tax=Lentibacillus persicus TaxID=640948 RepID=A0A1I1X9J7_9BACI|nr:energy-coupling factor transporter ATPase [Lentibacillus persicus]SFE03308.1 energy-coupling factor transport system ATP-binding protein [Lentibacillus persicus]
MTQLNRRQQALLEVKDFSFWYEENIAPLFQHLNVTLNQNEVTLLMGASGTGKSSLALCLNGLYPEAVEGIASGEIVYNGKNIMEFEKGELTQEIGIVFQDPDSQFCMITVEDELAFTLENIKVPALEIHARIKKILKAVGMEGFEQHKIHELSGGQKQKIALAAVLLLKPEMLILDEPTANLDPVSSLEFIQLVEKIQKDHQISVLIIEHQADDWLELIDRVLVISRDGRLAADDVPMQLFTKQKQLLEQEGVFLPGDYSSQPTLRERWIQTEPSRKRILSIRSLSFSYRNHEILRKVTFDVFAGEFLVIAGENGAGKSTMLQLMAGLLSPKAGNVCLFDRPLAKWKEKALRKRIGFVFQNPEHQFITDTVYDELTFGMKLNGVSDQEMEKAAADLMEQFHLTPYRLNNPFSLSGGQKRRLSVATVLDETPDILLFDEPTFGQDAGTTSELMDYVMDLKAKGTAIVFVTHDMNIADTADNIVVLKKGKVAFSGSPDSLWKQKGLLYEARLRMPASVRKGKGELHGLIH